MPISNIEVIKICSPEFSFNVTENGKVFVSLEEQSHSALSSKESVNDDEVLKISYNYITKEYDFDVKPFTPRASHLRRIDETIKKYFGTWKLCRDTLSKIALHDEQVLKNMTNLFDARTKACEQFSEYEDYVLSEDARSIIVTQFLKLFSIRKNRIGIWR